MGPRYVLRKVVQAIVTIIFVVIINFLLFRMMPGSPERILFRNPNLTQETMAAARETLGLNDPMFPVQISIDPPGIQVSPKSQLLTYLQSTAAGDFGDSFQFRGQSVTDVIGGPVLADDHPHRARRGHRHHRGSGAGIEGRLETRQPAGPRRQRHQPDPVFDAVLRHRHAPDHHLRGEPGLVPDLRDALARDATTRRSWTSSLDFARHLVLPLATVSLGLDRRLFDPHALLDHRDPHRGLRHDRTREGPARVPRSSTTTRSRTPCCRR